MEHFQQEKWVSSWAKRSSETLPQTYHSPPPPPPVIRYSSWQLLWCPPPAGCFRGCTQLVVIRLPSHTNHDITGHTQLNQLGYMTMSQHQIGVRKIRLNISTLFANFPNHNTEQQLQKQRKHFTRNSASRRCQFPLQLSPRGLVHLGDSWGSAHTQGTDL